MVCGNMGLLDRLKNRNEISEENKEEIKNEPINDDPIQYTKDHNWNVPFRAYEGNGPYIFISYAHKDANLVYPELKRFHEYGLNIWYDQGIAPGNEWTDEIAEALHDCSLFIVFISHNSVNSINVRNEINYALDENKPFLAIHLEETEIKGGLKLRISSLQAILKYTTTEDEYVWRCKKNFRMNGLLEDEIDETQQNVPSQKQSQPKTVKKTTTVKHQNKKPALPSFKTSNHLEEFERLNTTTDSIYDLGEYEVLIILKDGTNLTSWADVEWKHSFTKYNDDVLYVSEDLSKFSDLSAKYSGLNELKAIVATGVTNNVSNIFSMFYNCRSLEDISSLNDWDTSRVTTMEYMFLGCKSLEDISSLSNWDTSQITEMGGLFDGCESLEDISCLSNWDTSKVKGMYGMFDGCESLEDISCLSNWDTSKVKMMRQMFRNCVSLEDISALSNWNISKVRDMRDMFKDCINLKDASCLNDWDTSKVKEMEGMFQNCKNINTYPKWY